MDNAMKNEILAAIEKLNVKIDIMQKEVAKIPEIQKEVAKIPEMQKELAKIPQMQKELKKIPEMQKELAKISEMQTNIRNINRSVAIIEHEHGDKLKALFDAFMINAEKIETYQKRIHLCERKIEKHDAQIDYLTTKMQSR